MPEKLSGAVVAALDKTVKRHEQKERDAAEAAAAAAAPQSDTPEAAAAPPARGETALPPRRALVEARTPHILRPFVWLRRRKAVWYPFVFVLSLGTAILAYDVYRGGEYAYTEGRAEAAGYVLYLNYLTYLVYLCLALWAAIPLFALTITTIIPWLALLLGVGVVLYQLYGYLDGGAWTAIGADRLIDVSGWVPADGAWAGALAATPLSLLLLVGGGVWYVATARWRG